MTNSRSFAVVAAAADFQVLDTAKRFYLCVGLQTIPNNSNQQELM
jgi:hypothetical protein